MKLRSIIDLFSREKTVIARYERDFDKWGNIPRINELRGLIDLIKYDNGFIKSDKLFNDFLDLYNNDLKIKYDGFKFYNSVKIMLVGKNNINNPVKLSLSDFYLFESTLFLVYINYYKNNIIDSVEDVVIKCAGGYFMKCLLMFVDEYDKFDSFPIKHDKFLRKSFNLNFQDDESEELYEFIHGYFAWVIYGDLSLIFSTYFKSSAQYLITCSAVKNGRDVTCEDVVVGYITVLKLLCDDLTPYIEKFYDCGELNE